MVIIFLNSMPTSLLIHISIVFVVLLSTTNSTWFSHGIVELLLVQSNPLIALSAAVASGCLLIGSKLIGIFFNATMTKELSVLLYLAWLGVVLYPIPQDAQCACWMSTSYHYSCTFDAHFCHICFSSSVVLGRCLACCMASWVYPCMKVSGVFSCTFHGLLCHIAYLSLFAVSWLFQLVVAGSWVVSLVYLHVGSWWWLQCCFPDHSEYLPLH